MRFVNPLIEGRLIRRYKRFLADIELIDGTVITAHTANPGKMLGLTKPGSRVFVSYHDNPKRKLKHTWELIRVGRYLVGVDPIKSNRLVKDAIARGVITELQGYASIRAEVSLGSSRIDYLLQNEERRCYVEVKTVTLMKGTHAMFPDGVTKRGRRHLEELAEAVQDGHRAVLCFVVQRCDVQSVGTADHIDPDYGIALRKALSQGVEAIAYRAKVRRGSIDLREAVPVVLSPSSAAT